MLLLDACSLDQIVSPASLRARQHGRVQTGKVEMVWAPDRRTQTCALQHVDSPTGPTACQSTLNTGILIKQVW